MSITSGNLIVMTDMVRAAPEVFSSSVDDDLIIFDEVKGDYFGSGPVGKAIWNAISSEIRVSELCDQLLKKFTVERSVCEKEVIVFLDNLRELGLITVKQLRREADA